MCEGNTESNYWIIKSQQLVRKIIHQCFICRRLEGQPYSLPSPPPLPEFRAASIFIYRGRFRWPIVCQDPRASQDQEGMSTHMLHSLSKFVPDLTTDSFFHCFKRFVARRGLPCRMISDNGKTFKAASKVIHKISSHDIIQAYSSNVGMEWSFNLEKAPWWGGIFERMIKAMKRCLKKTIGRANITYDKLMTVVTEAEMILNCLPFLMCPLKTLRSH